MGEGTIRWPKLGKLKTSWGTEMSSEKRGVTTMQALTIVLTKQVVLTEKTSSNIKKRIQTTERLCHQIPSCAQ